MRELENTRLKIRDEDIPAFETKILPMKKQAIDAISSFGDLQESLSDKCGVNGSDVSHIGWFNSIFHISFIDVDFYCYHCSFVFFFKFLIYSTNFMFTFVSTVVLLLYFQIRCKMLYFAKPVLSDQVNEAKLHTFSLQDCIIFFSII